MFEMGVSDEPVRPGPDPARLREPAAAGPQRGAERAPRASRGAAAGGADGRRAALVRLSNGLDRLGNRSNVTLVEPVGTAGYRLRPVPSTPRTISRAAVRIT